MKTVVSSYRFRFDINRGAERQLSVRNTAEATGFHDYANFLRRFKECFGCTPRECRKENK